VQTSRLISGVLIVLRNCGEDISSFISVLISVLTWKSSSNFSVLILQVGSEFFGGL